MELENRVIEWRLWFRLNPHIAFYEFYGDKTGCDSPSRRLYCRKRVWAAGCRDLPLGLLGQHVFFTER